MWLPHRFWKKSAAFTLFFTICDLAIGDLAIECLGIHAIESLDVRVATNFVKMMKRKRFARNKVSNFGSTIPILLAVPRRKVFASFLSFFGMKEFCCPCSCRRFSLTFVEICPFVSLHISVTLFSYRYLWCHGATQEMSIVVRLSSIDKILLSIRGPAVNFNTSRLAVTCLRFCPSCASLLPFWRPSRSNGLLAIESHRVSFPLNDSLVQDSTALSKLGTWLLFFTLFHRVGDKRHKHRILVLVAGASSRNGTGRFWISVPARMTPFCPSRESRDGILR